MDTKEAYRLRNTALREFKFRKHANKRAARVALQKVLDTTEMLIQAIADKRSNPPDPLQSFTHEGIAYSLQRWVDGQAIYVHTDRWVSPLYRFEYPDKLRKVRMEICEIAPEIIEIIMPLAPIQKSK